MAEIQYNNDKTTVPNNLPPRLMRNLMMCKGGLNTKGAIYVGTGEMKEVKIYNRENDFGIDSKTYEVPTLKVITPPENADPNTTYVLTAQDGEISWVEEKL